MHYQFKRHKIRWEAGDHSFKDAMDDIRKKVEDRSVYVKGFEKVQFLQNELWLVHDLEFIPSFKKLNNCYSDWCEYRHGSYCARRKVHELKNYIDTHKLVLY